MRFVELDQRSDAWFDWRKNGITASESPVIVGMSPYQTPWRLWAEKTGFMERPDLSGNPNVQRGVLLEDAVRERIAQEMCDIIEPACAEWDHDPIFRASFDGLTSSNLPVEIKCPSERVFEDVKTNRENSKTFQLYNVQVQHQMLVADAPKGYLVFFCNDELLKFEILRDEAIIGEILTKGREFFNCVVEKQEPELDPERDVYIPRDEDAKTWLFLARDYRNIEEKIADLKAKIAMYEDQQVELKNSLKELCGNHVVVDFAGVAVRHSFVKGRVDYKKALEKSGVTLSEDQLETFRSKPSERWNFKVTESDVPKDLLDEDIIASAKDSSLDVKSLWWD